MPKLEKLDMLGTKSEYYKLAEFNDTVLAFTLLRGPYPSLQYVTWRQRGPGDFTLGHYFSGDNDAVSEQQAMRDFCVRSGLLRSCDLLANDKLPEISEMVDRLIDRGLDLQDEKLLQGVQRQIDEILHKPKEMAVNRDVLAEMQEYREIPDHEIDMDMEV